jgi:hypothetical protein
MDIIDPHYAEREKHKDDEADGSEEKTPPEGGEGLADYNEDEETEANGGRAMEQSS